MKTCNGLFLVILVGAFSFTFVEAGKSASEYLTEDAQLKEVLEIKDVQGGFAGFTGWLWKIEKNGDWKKYQVFNQKLTAKEEGKLSKEQLSILAKELARYDLLHLTNKGKPSVNPHIVTLQFGKHKAELVLGAGQPLPLPSPNVPPGVEQRFGGINQALQALLKTPKEKEKK